MSVASAVLLSAPIAASAAVGSWSIVPSPDASGATASHLEKVACATTTECWAAGFAELPNQTTATLIERWDGTSWTIVPSPNPGTDGQLWNVACASATQCWAVGQYGIFPQIALVAEWNGTAWTQVTVPDPSTEDVLQGVTCVSTTDCWAVGFQNGNTTTLIEHWNGTAWTVTPSPNTGTPLNNLEAVTCVSASDCWAVGSQAQGTFVEKWDGSAWSIVSSPNNTAPGTAENDLFAVTCTAAYDCWAVGQTLVGTDGASVTLIEHWNGTAWSIVSSPNAPSSVGGSSSLDGVACISATTCWAVGGGGDPTFGTLVEEWSGTAWTIVTSPNPASATFGGELLGATCDSGTCWGVGDSFSETTDTLTEEYTAQVAATPTPTPTPTASPTPGSTASPTPTASPAGSTISVPSAGAPPSIPPPATPLILLGAGVCGTAGALAGRRRRRS